MTYMYKVVEGNSQFKVRADSMRKKGFLVRVVKTATGYALYADANAVRALGGTTAGRSRRKFH